MSYRDYPSITEELQTYLARKAGVKVACLLRHFDHTGDELVIQWTGGPSQREMKKMIADYDARSRKGFSAIKTVFRHSFPLKLAEAHLEALRQKYPNIVFGLEKDRGYSANLPPTMNDVYLPYFSPSFEPRDDIDFRTTLIEALDKDMAALC